MALENKTLASVNASLDVEIVTVKAIIQKLPDRQEVIEFNEEISPRGYNITVESKTSSLRYSNMDIS